MKSETKNMPSDTGITLPLIRTDVSSFKNFETEIKMYGKTKRTPPRLQSRYMSF